METTDPLEFLARVSRGRKELLYYIGYVRGRAAAGIRGGPLAAMEER